MTDAPPLVEAKLARPRPRSGVVARARLFAALDSFDDTELTLLSAPPGSGKTVLVASWLAERPELAVAWVTLDAADDDPVRLWTYVAYAVDRVRSGLGRPALGRLRTPREPVDAAIDELLNALAAYDGRVAIVLDDLHHVTGASGSYALTYAVERLPPTARILATTRADPGIPLGRLRARRALGEVRARDLAFTVPEVRELLVGKAGIGLDDDDLELLVRRTEGWPTGVSLAGLWLAASDAPGASVRAFSGNQSYVADFLTSEVLDAVDASTRDFLLSTSVFDRFTASLCDSVLGRDDSARILADLGQSNLFLVPLDERGDWFRYHHLFRDLLRMDLTNTRPEAVAELHSSAAAWFAEQGLFEEALEHAAATGDPAVLADQLGAAHIALVRGGRPDVLMTWLERLPEGTLAEQPVLAAAGALASALLTEPAAIRGRLTAVAEAGAPALPDASRVYVEGVVAISRALALDSGLGPAVAHAQRALELARRGGDELVVAALAGLAYMRYLEGDTEAARELADEAVVRPEAPKRPHGVVYAHAVRALVECDADHPRAAEAQARHAVALARKLGLAGAWSAGIAHHALGQALLMLGQARDAERELERAEVLRRAPEPRLDHAHTLIVLAEAYATRGRFALAASALDGAREQLDAVGDAGRLPGMAAAVTTSPDGEAPTVEPPSLAELAVLRMLAGELSQREIAGRLYLSLNTVKTHSRNLYRKLDVSTREDAVVRAHSLGLIEQLEVDSPG